MPPPAAAAADPPPVIHEDNIYPDPRNNEELVKCYNAFVADWAPLKWVHANGKNRQHRSPKSQVSKKHMFRV
jgi:hypothetical protein